MYYTNCGSFDCGRGRSGQPFQKPHLNMQRSNLVRTKLFHFWRCSDIHFRRTSDRHVVTASWAHRRLGEALNTRARVPVLHVTL